MTATAVLASGSVASYTSAGFTAANFNSLANGSVVVASTAYDNSSIGDLFSNVSFIFTVGGTTTSTSYLSLYVLPLNQDASTYGDATANGTTAPTNSYWKCNVGILSGVTSGNTIVGTFPKISLDLVKFKYAIVNNLGVALNSSAAATVDHITSKFNLNA